ncbi:hypothetical protein QBC38DRAFT_462924 [Podospora fimiseda]|uniref:Uncharacterized protein n=1 Tax=Podospora fimiseda TaxID=252190 RepID=A0AAN7BZG3_9PEZI|nr:hypothetical protein QBC38DRAFT_462924 [Podospora fimiseda]
MRSRAKSQARTTTIPSSVQQAAIPVPDANDIAELVSKYCNPPAQQQQQQQQQQDADSSMEEGEISTSKIPDRTASGVNSTSTATATAMSAPPKPTAGNNDGKKTTPTGPKVEYISPLEAMQRLLDKVPDLYDWLEMTEWHDAESRNSKLDRYRRAKALAAQRKKLEEEERKLLEEEEREKQLQRTASFKPTSASPHGIAASLLTSASSSPSTTTAQYKREWDYNDERDEQKRGPKSPRLSDRGRYDHYKPGGRRGHGRRG